MTYAKFNSFAVNIFKLGSMANSKMRLFRSALFAFIPLLTSYSSSFAADEAEQPAQIKELKVLAIGNSFSGNILHFLTSIANSDGSKLILYQVAI